MSEENSGMLLARITIERRMTDDDVVDYVSTEDGQDEPLGISEALGMMRLAEDTLLRSRDEETP